MLTRSGTGALRFLDGLRAIWSVSMVAPIRTTNEQMHALEQRLERLELALGDCAYALRRIAEIAERMDRTR